MEHQNPYVAPSPSDHDQTRSEWRPLPAAVGLRMLVGMVAATITTFTIAIGFLAQRRFVFARGSSLTFFGGDLWALSLYSIPLATLLLVVGLSLNRLTRRWSSLARVVLVSLSGASIGFGWTLVVAMLLGPWFGAFSFPVVYCWIAGSIAGLLGMNLFQPHSVS